MRVRASVTESHGVVEYPTSSLMGREKWVGANVRHCSDVLDEDGGTHHASSIHRDTLAHR